jgi:hypothetical protein
MFPSINYLGVIVAALAGIFLGFLWYGPLFGKAWMKLMGFSKESIEKQKKKGMGASYAMMTLGTLLMAYVLAHTTEFAMNYTNIYGMTGGLMSGVWTWAGFVVPVKIGDQLWGGKSWKLFLLDGGYSFVSLALMGVIVATWR